MSTSHLGTPSRPSSTLDIQVQSKLRRCRPFSIGRRVPFAKCVSPSAFFCSAKFLLKDNEVELSGGGLNGTYSTIQLHFHWGDTEHHPGSEHAIDGHRHAMEVPCACVRACVCTCGQGVKAPHFNDVQLASKTSKASLQIFLCVCVGVGGGAELVFQSVLTFVFHSSFFFFFFCFFP